MRRGCRWILGCLALCSCQSSPDGPVPVREPFIALSRDFAGFSSWRSVELDAVDVPGGHEVGDRSFLYINRTPPVEGEPFAIGTILVKTVETGSRSDWAVHAMAKRGGQYNVNGAMGWEWFDLQLQDGDQVLISWRGEGSAADPGGYGPPDGGTMVGCNSCHVLALSRDFVFSRSLLAGLE